MLRLQLIKRMNNKIILSLLAVLIFLAVSAFVLAKPTTPSFGIPEHAVEIAPGLFSLGTAVADGKVVEGLMFVHYKRENAKSPHASGGKGGTTCYTFLAKGAKWKTIEPYLVDPSNAADLNEGFVRSNLALDIDEWETAAGVGILGDEFLGSVDRANIGNLNGQNEVIFADVSSPGAIAVTIVWGIFYGPPSQKELVEWDQIYDDVDFGWSSTGAGGAMDFENIAQHELGHSVGLGHPPDSCTEETMYAYADYGETKKRTLNAGDITGINELY